jgi:hypothetical protein
MQKKLAQLELGIGKLVRTARYVHSVLVRTARYVHSVIATAFLTTLTELVPLLCGMALVFSLINVSSEPERWFAVGSILTCGSFYLHEPNVASTHPLSSWGHAILALVAFPCLWELVSHSQEICVALLALCSALSHALSVCLSSPTDPWVPSVGGEALGDWLRKGRAGIAAAPVAEVSGPLPWLAVPVALRRFRVRGGMQPLATPHHARRDYLVEAYRVSIKELQHRRAVRGSPRSRTAVLPLRTPVLWHG